MSDDGNKSNVRLPWGKHKGERLRNVPRKYLNWLWESRSKLPPPLRSAVERTFRLRLQAEIADLKSKLAALPRC